jgi:hypothetical protein
MRRFITLFAALVVLAFVPSSLAASATLFGGATKDGKRVKLVADVSNASTADDFSGINFTGTGVTMSFSSLTRLSTKFNVTDDDCAAGSPRFQINFGPNQNTFVYLGPSPTFTDCPKNTFVDSGNLIGNNDACRWDTSQIQAGTQCNTYTGARALLGSREILSIQLVVDASWNGQPWIGQPEFADREQTVLVCDIHINSNRFFFPCQGKGKGKGAGGANKVTICHHTQGKNGTKHVTITISESAWPAHQGHGDTRGACTSAANVKAHNKAAHVKKFHKKAKGKKGGR